MKKNIANRNTVLDSSVSKRSGSQEYDWADSFALTEHWQSDLIFYGDEIRFFRSLIDRNFLALIEKENIDRTRVMAVRLTDLENERLQLEKKTAGHLVHLGSVIKNSPSHDVQMTLDEHGEKETAMTDFVKKFQLVKRDIFKLTEHVMESEKAKHLLGK